MSISSVPTIVGDSTTSGTMLHNGRLIVSCMLANGVVAKITLPDDWQTLLNRVAVLEARTLEDMKYGH